MSRPRIAVLGTCDTKLAETLFLRDQIIKAGEAEVLLLDVGRTPVQNSHINVPSSELALRKSAGSPSSLAQVSRADYIKYMIECATSFVAELFQKGEIHGIVSAAGSSGTSLVTAVMRNALPVGFPKFMVSTMASGDVSHLVEETVVISFEQEILVVPKKEGERPIQRIDAGAVPRRRTSTRRYAPPHRRRP